MPKFEAEITAENLDDFNAAFRLISEAAGDESGNGVWEASVNINKDATTGTVRYVWVQDDGKRIEGEGFAGTDGQKGFIAKIVIPFGG